MVTTVKSFGSLAHSWCTYHLGIGFAHLFIFFDDPAELAVVGLEERFGAERVTCVAHDDALRAAWATLPNADAMLAHAETEVQSRQQLNAWLAVDLAASKGLDWLLHIDADELFHPGADVDAPAHFAELSRAGVATFCYMNHEGVPEASDIVDPFVEVTLFKRSLDVVERTDAAREAVGLWDERLAGSYFFYYDNGKAAVRLTGKPRPLSVHEWLPGSAEGMGAWYSNLRTPWAGRGRLKEVVQYMSSSACILHYPCYNADSLWTRWKRGNDNCECRPRELANPHPYGLANLNLYLWLAACGAQIGSAARRSHRRSTRTRAERCRLRLSAAARQPLERRPAASLRRSWVWLIRVRWSGSNARACANASCP